MSTNQHRTARPWTKVAAVAGRILTVAAPIVYVIVESAGTTHP